MFAEAVAWGSAAGLEIVAGSGLHLMGERVRDGCMVMMAKSALSWEITR